MWVDYFRWFSFIIRSINQHFTLSECWNTFNGILIQFRRAPRSFNCDDVFLWKLLLHTDVVIKLHKKINLFISGCANKARRAFRNNCLYLIIKKLYNNFTILYLNSFVCVLDSQYTAVYGPVQVDHTLFNVRKSS